MKRLTWIAATLGLFALALGGLPARAEFIAAFHGGVDAQGNFLLTFDSATPDNATVTPITGTLSGESIVDIDYRPTDGKVYALTLNGNDGRSRLLTLDVTTGVASLVTTFLSTDPFNGSSVMDFNPVTGLLHVTSFLLTDNNLVVDPATGQITVNPSYPAGIDTRSLGFTNNVAGAATTTLYGATLGNRTLYLLDPSTGSAAEVGPLGITGSPTGLDVSGATGIAYLQNGNFFGTVNLATGAFSNIGPIAGGQYSVNGFTVVPAAAVPEPSSLVLSGVGAVISLGLAASRRMALRVRLTPLCPPRRLRS
jgi:hypothetical protein